MMLLLCAVGEWLDDGAIVCHGDTYCAESSIV